MGKMNFRNSLGILAIAVTLAPLPANAVQNYVATPLGRLGGSTSYGVGLNAIGQTTGGSFTAGDAAVHAFRHSGAAMVDLGTL